MLTAASQLLLVLLVRVTSALLLSCPVSGRRDVWFPSHLPEWDSSGRSPVRLSPLVSIACRISVRSSATRSDGVGLLDGDDEHASITLLTRSSSLNHRFHDVIDDAVGDDHVDHHFVAIR